ncbi:MAG: heat-inducible transcriptional repressor HrcA [Gemmatimonadota bacterium]|jgi:heat-inducible transcriptional repressor
MDEKEPPTFLLGEDLTDRERRVLEAVVRIYVATAEPAGSRTVSRQGLGVSPATVRNTMSDLEDKGYLFHPHASAGRVPTDHAYRFFVDRIIRPEPLGAAERVALEEQLEQAGSTAAERLVRQATRALSVISTELGVAVAPRLQDAALEKIELVQVSTDKVLMVATIRGGLVRTVYVDLPGEVPSDTLVTLTVILNERLAGLSLHEIRGTLTSRLRDAPVGDRAAEEFLNIFMQSGAELFDWSTLAHTDIHLGNTSVLAAQPEFTTGDRLKSLLELTERRDLLLAVLGSREHGGGLKITIGTENESEELSEFTLVTSEYRVGDLQGVIGVIGPTRMPYEKVIAIVDYTSRLVSKVLRSS